MPPTPAGWSRFLVKSKFDPATEDHRYFVDGKMRPRPSAQVRDGVNEVVYQTRGTLLGIPKHMTITDAIGAEVATTEVLAPQDIADGVFYMVTRPRHTSINEFWIMPTDQV